MEVAEVELKQDDFILDVINALDGVY